MVHVSRRKLQCFLKRKEDLEIDTTDEENILEIERIV